MKIRPTKEYYSIAWWVLTCTIGLIPTIAGGILAIILYLPSLGYSPRIYASIWNWWVAIGKQDDMFKL